jgi:hypothetical protein
MRVLLFAQKWPVSRFAGIGYSIPGNVRAVPSFYLSRAEGKARRLCISLGMAVLPPSRRGRFWPIPSDRLPSALSACVSTEGGRILVTRRNLWMIFGNRDMIILRMDRKGMGQLPVFFAVHVSKSE